MKRLIVIMFAAALIMVSCGKQHQAEAVVDDFLKENLSEGFKFSTKYRKLDSTRYVTENSIRIMRGQAAKMEEFKSDIDFGKPPKKHPMLMMLGTKLKNHDTIIDMTFYLNQELTQVVAFKTN